MRSAPGIFVALCAGIAVGWGLMFCVGCAASPSSHDEVHVTAYAADRSLCVSEAQSYDAGEACFAKYDGLYAPFWPDAAVEAPIALDGGVK